MAVASLAFRKIGIIAIALILLYPTVAVLGIHGWISKKVEVSAEQIRLKKESIYRIKGIEPEISLREVSRTRFLDRGHRYQRVSFSWQLSEEGSEGKFWARGSSFHFVPLNPSDLIEKNQRFVIVRGWRPSTGLTILWAVVLIAFGGFFFRSQPFRNEIRSICSKSCQALLRPVSDRQRHLQNFLFLTAGVLVIFFRFETKLRHPFFVAEDGAVFFQQDRMSGMGAVFDPYAGYLHLVPRLIAWVVGYAELEWIPALYTWTSFAVILLVIWSIWRLLGRGPEAWLVAFGIFLFPDNLYLFGNPTNLQWFLAFFLFVFAANSVRPTNLTKRILLFASALLVGLTGPFTILIWPTFFLRWWAHRDRWSLSLLILQTVTSFIQATSLLTENTAADGTSSPLEAPVAAFLEACTGIFFPQFWFSVSYQASTWIAGVLMALVGLVWIIDWKKSKSRIDRTNSLSYPVTFFAFILAGLVRGGGDIHPWGNGERYFFVPDLILLASLVRISWRVAGIGRWTAVGLSSLGFTTLIGVTNPVKTDVASWRDQLRAIPPGGTALVEAWPRGDEWTVFVARDADGKFLKREAYVEALRWFNSHLPAPDAQNPPAGGPDAGARPTNHAPR